MTITIGDITIFVEDETTLTEEDLEDIKTLNGFGYTTDITEDELDG